MNQHSKTEEHLIRWNYSFPLDRWYRKKYNIPLFSEQHLNTSQIDITFEYLEDKMFEGFIVKSERDEQRQRDYENGIWLKPGQNITKQQEEDLFLKLDPYKLNKPEDIESSIKVE